MPTLPPDPSPELNPYAPPEANLGEMPVPSADLAEAEAIRRKHIAQETSIKSLGSLQLLGGSLLLLVLAGFLAATIVPGPGRSGLVMYGMAAYLALLAAISFALGFGLRNLRPWARWITAVLIMLSLLASIVSLAVEGVAGGQAAGIGARFVGSAIIPVYILHLLLSAKGSMVFSPEYQTIIARTPHVKMKTSWLVKGCLIVLVALFTMIVLAMFVSYFSISR
jgi:hypothetical protein